MKQIPLAISAGAARSFDGFLPGANVQALDHLRALAPHAPPVYLWGAAGTGKTHLLQALVQRLHEDGQRVGWFDGTDPSPWVFDDGWSLIAIDGCELLDEPRQQAAFALFVQAAVHGIPVVAAGRLPPVDLPLREDLRTRLGWGHVFALQPLTEPEVRAVLRREADRRGVRLSDEVMDYLLTRFERDPKHLMAQLDRLDEFSLSMQRAVTVPLLRQMLAEEGGA
jgi:DnaA family protein